MLLIDADRADDSWTNRSSIPGNENPDDAARSDRRQERRDHKSVPGSNRQLRSTGKSAESTKEGRTAARADRSSGLCGTGILPVAKKTGKMPMLRQRKKTGQMPVLRQTLVPNLKNRLGPGLWLPARRSRMLQGTSANPDPLRRLRSDRLTRLFRGPPEMNFTVFLRPARH